MVPKVWSALTVRSGSWGWLEWTLMRSLDFLVLRYWSDKLFMASYRVSREQLVVLVYKETKG